MSADPKNIEIALSIVKKLIELIGCAFYGDVGITDKMLAEAMGEYDKAKKKLVDLEKKVSDADD